MAVRGRPAFFLVICCLVCAWPRPARSQHAPEAAPGRPGPYAFELAPTAEPLEAVPGGWIRTADGRLAALLGRNDGPYAGDPADAALAWLDAHGREFGLAPGPGLRLDRVSASPAGIHVRFTQQIGAVPVWKADVVVSLDRSGRIVRAAHSSYDPLLDGAGFSPVPAVPAAAALEAAVRALGIAGSPQWIGSPSTSLWILRREDRVGSPARLAWRVALAVQDPMGDWEVWVDAADGRILRLSDQELFTDGGGYCFDPDPLSTARVDYGGPYADHNDADDPELDAQRRPIVLKDLACINFVYQLQGPYVYLDDFEYPAGAPASSHDPYGFFFHRSEQGFEDVMVYYQIDTNQRYLQSLGFNGVQNAPIHVDSHGLNGADNSHYLPSQNRIAYGEGGVDDAEDADVILHEYGHAIVRAIVPYWGGGDELAMGEGFGDYWAGSSSASLSDYRSNWVFNWDGHNEFWAGRALDSPLGYGSRNGDPYHDGSIWSAVWWLIRAECGRSVADTDLLAMHSYLGSSATMPQAAAFAMQADRDVYGGLHAGSLKRYFVQRGFLTDSQYDIPVLTHTPLPDTVYTAAPLALTARVTSQSPVLPGSVKVKYSVGPGFNGEAVMVPTGNPNEWIGVIPRMDGVADLYYYLIADNQAGWRGATPAGAELRDYTVHYVGPASAPSPARARRFALELAGPNPAAGASVLRFDLAEAGKARLTVHDLQGRVVRVLVDGLLPAGAGRAVWDGRDGAERPVSSGLYFATLEAPGGTRGVKILRLQAGAVDP